MKRSILISMLLGLSMNSFAGQLTPTIECVVHTNVQDEIKREVIQLKPLEMVKTSSILVGKTEYKDVQLTYSLANPSSLALAINVDCAGGTCVVDTAVSFGEKKTTPFYVDFGSLSYDIRCSKK